MRIQGICGSSQDFVPRGHFIRRPGNGARRWESQRANERTKVSSDRRAFCERTKKEALDEARVCASARTPEWAHSLAMPLLLDARWVCASLFIYWAIVRVSINPHLGRHASVLWLFKDWFICCCYLYYYILREANQHKSTQLPVAEGFASRSELIGIVAEKLKKEDTI